MKEGKKKQLIKFALFSILFLFFGVFNTNVSEAAILYFNPSSGNFSVGNIFTVDVLVNTEGVAINNAEAIVNFPSELLEVVSFSKSGSIFSLWVEEPSFSNSLGILNFNGGLPTPGFNGTNGKIISVVFRVKKTGSATVVFTSPAIRANDGYGTNVFRIGSQALYNLIAAVEKPILSPTPIPTPTLIGLPRLPVISSSTHPDPNKWYSNSNPFFEWQVPEGTTEVRLTLSRNAKSTPIVRYVPPISSRKLEDLSDGVWYLHAQFANNIGLGPVGTFKFQIDTQLPKDFEIIRLDTDDLTNPRPELLFESSDTTSGIDHYEITINNEDPIIIEADKGGKAYALPFQMPGEKNIKITAFDKAGNKTSSNLIIIVKSIEPPKLDKVSTKIKEGQPLVVEGITQSDKKILIHVVDEKGVEKIYEANVGENGRFVGTINDLSAGRYKIYAKAQGKRGEISDPSNEMISEVGAGGFLNLVFRLFDLFINILSTRWIFILFILTLVGLIVSLVDFIVCHTREHIYNFVEKIFKFFAGKSKKDKKELSKNIELIIKEIIDELKYLKKIEQQAELSPEEKYLKNKLSSYLKKLKLIKKEIEN
jgi:hypothetical protein